MKELQESQVEEQQKASQSQIKSGQQSQNPSQKNSKPSSLRASQQSFKRQIQIQSQQSSQNQSRLLAQNQPVKQTSQILKSSNLQPKNSQVQNPISQSNIKVNNISILEEMDNQPDFVSQIVEDRNNSIMKNNSKNGQINMNKQNQNIQLMNDNLVNESLDYNSFVIHDDNPPQYDQFSHKGAKFRLRANKTALYCQENVYKILQQGLIEMNKQNPKNPIRFLGVYLMEQSDKI